MSRSSFSGFYLRYKGLISGYPNVQPQLEHLTCEFYKQAFKKMDYYGSLPVVIDEDNVNLAESYMTVEPPQPPNPFLPVSEDSLEYRLFRGSYMRPLRCGTALLHFLLDILRSLGMKEAENEVNEKLKTYQKENKSNPCLRTACWYICQNFILKLPGEYQLAFVMDCLLYSDWHIDHPNVVGLQMLALAWMLGVPEFKQFLPDSMVQDAPILREPPLAKALEKMKLQENFVPH